MARKHKHEDHTNHEAWAIPYGDLVTLLLAFFVVMYAVSSVNEGKYRVMADAMSSAFGGAPRSVSPIQLGETQLRGSSFDRPSMQTAAAKNGPASMTPVNLVHVRQVLELPNVSRGASPSKQSAVGERREAHEREQQLNALGTRIQNALTELVKQNLVTVRRGRTYLEVEIQSDILFASGAATPSPVATSTVRKLAVVLRDSPNAVRVEGYTDDRPIRTAQFTSNWELSAARAAGVVHVMIDEGVGAGRLAVVGYGEHQPVADNTTETGRNANRRVLLVILAAPQGPDAVPDPGPMIAMQEEHNPPVVQTDSPAAATSAALTDARVPHTPINAARLIRSRAASTAQTGSAVAVRIAPFPGAG